MAAAGPLGAWKHVVDKATHQPKNIPDPFDFSLPFSREAAAFTRSFASWNLGLKLMPFHPDTFSAPRLS
jgi:hypothetical protein